MLSRIEVFCVRAPPVRLQRTMSKELFSFGKCTSFLAGLVLALALWYPGRGVLASEKAGRTDAESYVLEQVAAGNPALLAEEFPTEEGRRLGRSFIRELLTNPDKRTTVHPHGITIDGAVIPDGIDLKNEEVSYDVTLRRCQCDGDLDFTQCQFAKSLSIEGTVFGGAVDFTSASIGFNFMCDGAKFNKPQQSADTPEVTFNGIKVGGDFSLTNVEFAEQANFTQAEITGNYLADDSTFHESADFNNMKVKSDGYFRRTTFEGLVDFREARFTNLLLTDSHFLNTKELVSFESIRMDTGFLDRTSFEGPVKIEGMTFQNLSPTSWEKLQSLATRSDYNAEFYSNLEMLFRKHGYSDQADAVFIAQRRRARHELLNGIEWFWNFLQDLLIGYGRHLERLLLWSTVFIFIGFLVFRREADMKTKGPDDGGLHKGRYSPFWYSLDLFLPVMHLGDADIWTPKDERRMALLYKRFHIIIGALFVPIGLAAWTGIIK